MSDVHKCHAARCNRFTPPSKFACRWHWFRLHYSIQQAIWREYKPGQENTKTPSKAYLAVQQCAVAYLAKLDNLKDEVTKAGLNAVMYEAMCREQGEEPLRRLPRAWE